MTLFKETNQKLCPLMLNMCSNPPTPQERTNKPATSRDKVLSAICFGSDCAWWIPETEMCSMRAPYYTSAQIILQKEPEEKP